MKSFQFTELGTSGFKTTNVARQVVSNTIPYIDAPASGGGIVIYQIDWDSNSATGQIIVGDNNAVDGVDRIALNVLGLKTGTVVYPQGFLCTANKPVQVQFAGATTNAWVRITYTTN